MGHHRTYRRRIATRASLAVLGIALLCLALAATALAAPPTHLRKASLDITGLNHACGAAVDNKGDVYASSPGNDEIKVYNPSHVLIATISNANEPCGLAVDSHGDLFVSEKATGKVVRYVPDAYPLTATPSYDSPEAIDSSGQAAGIAIDATRLTGNSVGFSTGADDSLFIAKGDHVDAFRNERQGVNVTCTAGTYTLELGGQKTSALPCAASHAEVQSALEALSTIGKGNVAVTTANFSATDHLVTFTGNLGLANVGKIAVDISALTGSAAQSETNGGALAPLATDPTANYTGVAAYTYQLSGSNSTPYLYTADPVSDEVKVLSGPSLAGLKARRTLAVDLSAAGAQLALDPGNMTVGGANTGKCAPVAEQACTAGHLLAYDAGEEEVVEYDATGEFLDMIESAALEDGEPTALAVDRSGTATDGTIYVGAGPGPGAKLLAFGPLGAPTRAANAALSRALTGAREVAVDDWGNVYVASQGSPLVRVYGPDGKQLTEFEDEQPAYDLAVDSQCNVYVLDGGQEEEALTYYEASACPPVTGTSFERHLPAIVPETTGLGGVAVNPANDHVFALGAGLKSPIVEFGTAQEGSPQKATCGSGLALVSGPTGIDVYGTNGRVYVARNPGPIMEVDCGANEIVAQTGGSSGGGQGCPKGALGATPEIAVDQSNGHPLVFEPGAPAREYDAAFSCVAEYGKFATGSSKPYSIAIDNGPFSPNQGTVYVAFDASDNKTQPFDVSAFGPLSYPAAVEPKEFKLTVSKSGTGAGKVTSAPAGIDCGLDCSEVYAEGIKVTLTAAPEGGSTFAGWSGSGCSGTGTCEVTMSAAKSVTAEFTAAAKPKFKLKVKKAGTGAGASTVTSSPSGINCGLDCEEEYDEGTLVTLTGAAGANTKPVTWTGCDSVNGENKCLVTMSGAKEVTATFALEQHLLSVSKTGSGTGKVTSSPAGIDCGATCSTNFDHGTLVTLTAAPEGGSTFAGWSGSGCSGTGKCEVTMSAAKAVTAEFTAAAKPKFALKVKKQGSGTGTVTSSPAGINCGLDCEEEYDEGTAVTLTGAAGANTKAVTWSNCDSVNGENKCLVTMSGAKEVTATFALEQHLLSVSKTGSGTGKVTSSQAGIDCGATCSASFDHGTVVTLSASPDAGSEFTGFSGACTGTGTCEVTMSAAKAVTATFDEEEAPPGGISLTVDVEGTGSGTVTSDKGTISCDPFCSDEYAEGTVVVLTATPSPGSVFYSWRYCDKGGVNGRQCTMTVDKAKTVKATFTTTHALEVSKAPGSGLGKVQSSPGGILCLFNCSETTASFKEGTQVTVKQTPAKHFHFVQWLGDCTGSGACELTMSADHEVSAKFAEDARHLLTLTKSGGGTGTVKSSIAGINCGTTCSQIASAYYQGEVVELTATPAKGSSLGSWSGCDSEPEGRCLVAMSEAKGVTAEFK